MNEIATRILEVQDRIEQAVRRSGRRATDVQVVAASKTISPEMIATAARCGVHAFGENRAQELLTKVTSPELQLPELRWHFIGRLQRNKVASLAAKVSLWQSVDRPELVDVIARHAPGANVLLQLHLGDETTKGGLDPSGLSSLLEYSQEQGLVVQGLMAVPPPTEDIRPFVEVLVQLADRHRLPVRSIGMSSDFERAVEHGSTMIRLGTAIFGRRTNHVALA